MTAEDILKLWLNKNMWGMHESTAGRKRLLARLPAQSDSLRTDRGATGDQ